MFINNFHGYTATSRGAAQEHRTPAEDLWILIMLFTVICHVKLLLELI